MCGLALVVAAAIPGRDPARASSKESKAAGAVLFREKGCAYCHGAAGVAEDRGPDLSSIGRDWKREAIERQVLVGGGGMPSFREELNAEELPELLDYLQTQRAKPARK